MSQDLPAPAPASSSAPDEPGKFQREIAALLSEISALRAGRYAQEAALRALEDRLETEVRPLEAKLGKARLETLRILMGHCGEDNLRRREGERLREALAELIPGLERDFGFDLKRERETLFGDTAPETLPDAAGRTSGDGSAEGDDAYAADVGFAGKHARRKAPAARAGNAGDIRALYLLLARALHPDKESDPARREAKTEWMKKVTAAYGGRDLAALLDILSQDPLATVGPYLSQAPMKAVRGFAKRLRRDLAELRGQAPQIRPGLDGAGLRRAVAELKQSIRFVRERNEAYRNREAVEAMIAELRPGNALDFM